MIGDNAAIAEVGREARGRLQATIDSLREFAGNERDVVNAGQPSTSSLRHSQQ